MVKAGTGVARASRMTSMPARQEELAAIELSDKLAFLATPGTLDTVVETIETHLSWVFLTAHRVYKLKKPVSLPLLDHRSLDRRRRSCTKELELGRRLAPTVYLGVVPLVATPRGLAIGDGEGAIVEWLVAMRRLPSTAMLPYALGTGAATPGDGDALGDVLAGFYRSAARTAWNAPEYRRRMRALVEMYAGELASYLPRERIATIARGLLAQIERCDDALGQRIAGDRVIDAHGDLRPEHVCLESPPVVIDPLEFDDDLRTLDAASELAFFTMECERLGASWFADRVVARYAQLTGDRAPPELVAIYRGQHALARALIAMRRTADSAPPVHARWRRKAEHYLEQARGAAGSPC